MKSQPSETPPQGPRAKGFAEALQRSAADPSGAPVSVEVRIAGGMPSKRYRFHFQARGPHDVRIDFLDDVRKAERKVDRVDLPQDAWRTLLGTIARIGAFDQPLEPPRFLPDTVVGWIEVVVGNTSRRVYFIADEKQARQQQKVPPKALLDAVATIYDISSRSMNMTSINP